tara:strand:+ start:505 stop:693 length:189 start_codon:yes stop_codon:yes gene_type:complete
LFNQSGCYGTPSLRKESKMEKLTKGEKLISKINMVFSLLQANRDDTAAAVLQQVFDELAEIK